MEDEYDFSHPERGVAVIINNEKFSSAEQEESDDRVGSSYDAAALDVMFSGLGFLVHRYDNLSQSAMVETLTSIAGMDIHSKSDSFACAVLSHGDATQIPGCTPRAVVRERQDYLLGSDGGAVLTASIIDIFSDTRCPGLAGKPRLFFFQACRGTNLDGGVGVQVKRIKPDRRWKQGDKTKHTDRDDAEDGNDDREEDTNYDSNVDYTDSIPFRPTVCVSPSNIHKDILVMYATPPGYYAWRRDSGAWFTQSLCRVLTPYNATHWSLTTLLTFVNRRVAFCYESSYGSDTTMNEKKQVPCITHMLTKDVYFRSKSMQHSTLV